VGELLHLRGVGHHAGPRTLFSGIDVTLAAGDRMGLVGANGAGKSTLLGILAGSVIPDAGSRVARRATRIAILSQEPVLDPERTVERFVIERLGRAPGPPPGVDVQVAARRMLSQAGFEDPRVRIGSLSGGWRRRVALTAELATEADLLLLDEPTNHLDLEGIEWLEERLRDQRAAAVLISHDRRFLESVCTRMAEVDPRHESGFFACEGPYSDFLESRARLLEGLRERESSLNSMLREEIRYLRQGPKARTSKNATRVARAHRNIAEHERLKRLNREKELDVGFSDTGRRTRRLLVAEGLRADIGGRTCFRELDLVLSPGTRVGLLGPNGSGKTTLLRTLLLELHPQEGRVRSAPGLRTVYFDQARERLDGEQTVRRALAPEGDTVQVGQRSVHVKSWARQLLFRDEQLDQPVSSLSGGERARLLIARLMRTPADVLLLDEPTNDLDIPTLEALESSLLDFEGAVVLVTHDRFLMDRVCTGLLALDGQGKVTEFADLAQFMASRPRRSDPRPGRQKSDGRRDRSGPPAPARAKLSYREKQELESMEERVLAAEERVDRLRVEAEDPSTDPVRVHRCYEELHEAQSEVDRLYTRWAELDEKGG
jgi:ATP-binding cassette subfamily F protein uup